MGTVSPGSDNGGGRTPRQPVDGRYAQVPEAVIFGQLGPDVIAVYAVLWRYEHHRSGRAWPTREQIALDLDIGPKRVTRATELLASAGLLVKRRRPNASVIYELHTPRALTSGKVKSDRSDPETPDETPGKVKSDRSGKVDMDRSGKADSARHNESKVNESKENERGEGFAVTHAGNGSTPAPSPLDDLVAKLRPHITGPGVTDDEIAATARRMITKRGRAYVTDWVDGLDPDDAWGWPREMLDAIPKPSRTDQALAGLTWADIRAPVIDTEAS